MHIATRFFALLLNQYRKDIIGQNIDRAYPSISKEEIKKLSSDYIKQLGNVIGETLKGHSMNQAEIAQRFVFNNPEIANKYSNQGKSIILCLGHIGNWEWGQAVVSHYLNAKCVGVYKQLSSKSFDRYLLSKRSKFDVHLHSQKAILKYIIGNRDEVCVYIFIADQYPPSHPKMKVNFFGIPTSCDSSIEKIASKYDLPVVYADIKNAGKHKYQTDLIEISSESASTEQGTITKQYASLLEQNIRREPALWLWSHRRWKDIVE